MPARMTSGESRSARRGLVAVEHAALSHDEEVGARRRDHRGEIGVGTADVHSRDAAPAQVRVVVEKGDGQVPAARVGQPGPHQLLAVGAFADEPHRFGQLARQVWTPLLAHEGTY